MKRAAKEAERAFGQMKAAAAEIGQVFGAAIATSATAITALIKSSIDAADHMNDLAKKIGVTTEAMSGLGYAASKSGADADALNSGLIKLAKNAADAAAGGKENAELFAAIGVSVKDASGEVKSADVLFREVADRFKDYKDGSAEAALAIKLFGKSGADLIQTLNEGSDGLKEMEDRAKALGLVISSDLASQSDEFNDTLGDIHGLLTGLGNAMAEAVLPTLQKFADLIVDSGIKAQATKDDFGFLVDALKGVAVGAAIVKNTIEALVNVLGAIGDATVATFSLLGTNVKNTFSLLEALATASPEKISAAWDAANQSNAAALAKFSGAIKVAYQTAADGVASSVSDVTDAFEAAYIPATNKAAAATKGLADEAGKADVPLSALGSGAADAAKAALKAAEDLAKAQKSAADMLDTLRGKNDKPAAAQADFDKGMRALEEQMQNLAIAGEPFELVLAAWQEGEELLRNEFDRTNAAIAEQGDILGTYLKSLKRDQALDQMTARQRAIQVAINQVTDAYKKEAAAGGKMAQSLKEVQEGAAGAAAAAFDLAKSSDVVRDFVQEFGQMSEFEKLSDGIEKVGEALDKAIGEGATEKVKQLRQSLTGMRIAMATGIIGVAKESLQSIQSLTAEGSRSFQALQVAIDLTTVAEAVLGVVHQATEGDVYSAIPRMAAMVAAMASLGVSVGNLKGSGFEDTAAKRQATQGTGSVLGDATAKSESIAKAVEITADATTQLVGLNRGMLSALQALQDALGSAGTMLARGAGTADFSGMKLATKSFDFKDPLANFLLGGSSKVTDQGIVIFGGALSELLQNVAVGAYQEVKSRSWVFGSTKTKTGIKDVSDEFEKQFGLVMQSIADTVREGALALGMLPADVEAALAAFRVEEIKISLKGLSTEDQQKEIQAVFSKIFDGLAGSVVPYIEQFQKVGEGLGETLVRIATEVQVAEEGFKQLGLAVDRTDPERFAQISDALIHASGGMDAFISGFQSFVANFAPDAYKFQVASDELQSAFSQVGLAVPKTRDEMWALMQSLDASTESGQKQIATILRLADVSNSYFDALEKQWGGQKDAVHAYAAIVADLDAQLKEIAGGGVTQFQKTLGEISATMHSTIEQLNTAARAAGLQGAREQDLAKVHQIAAARAAQAARMLEAASRDLVAQLYGDNGITDAAQSATSALTSVADGLGSVADAASEFRNSMLLDPQLSPLNVQQQFDEAMRQLTKTGDPEIARRALELAKKLTATGDDFTQLFNQITALVRPQAAEASSAASGAYDSSASSATTLTPAQRAELAQELARNVADLSGFSDTSYAQVAAGLGLDLNRLAEDLGLTGESLSDYLDAIKADSYSLDDVDTVLTRQVDRIVSAILQGKDIGGDITSSPIAPSDKGIADQVGSPYVESRAPGSDDSAPASEGATKDVADKVQENGLFVASAVASVGEEQIKESRMSRDEMREVKSLLRELVDAVRNQRSLRNEVI